MKSGFVWEPACHNCGKSWGGGETTSVWQKECPTFSPPRCAWCESAHVSWVRSYVPSLGMTVIVSKPEIETHYNASLGCVVRNRSHLEHLQSLYGVEDAVVKKPDSDGVPSSVPRDFERVAAAANAAAEAITDQMFEAPGSEDSPFEQVKEDLLEEMGEGASEQRASEMAEQLLSRMGLSDAGGAG